MSMCQTLYLTHWLIRGTSKMLQLVQRRIQTTYTSKGNHDAEIKGQIDVSLNNIHRVIIGCILLNKADFHICG